MSLTQCFEYLFHALQTVGNNLREEEEGRMGRREQEERGRRNAEQEGEEDRNMIGPKDVI